MSQLVIAFLYTLVQPDFALFDHQRANDFLKFSAKTSGMPKHCAAATPA
jgi:hypothetical protein